MVNQCHKPTMTGDIPSIKVMVWGWCMKLGLPHCCLNPPTISVFSAHQQGRIGLQHTFIERNRTIGLSQAIEYPQRVHGDS